MTPVCARCRRVMITTTRCGMQLTCWEHCLRPTAANSKRTWPVALNAGGRHRTLRVPALLSQLDRDEVAAISESAPTVVASGLSPELLPSLLAAVHRRRRRTRLITWVASSAAAAVLAIGVLVGVQGHSAAPQRAAVSALPMAQVGTQLLASTVSISGEPWGRSSTCGASAWRRRMLPTTRWPWLWWVVTAARHGWRLGWPNPVTPRHPPAAFRHRLTRSPPCKWLPPIPARFCCSVRSKTEL